ncbi:MAG: dihydrolipoamide acetyltransferase family protein, partial [Acidimicrobiales bacterium]
MSDFALPDLGEGLVEAEIVEWHVGLGDHVVAGQPLVSVETDKSVVEVPSPRSGTIAGRSGEPGDIVAVGTPLVTFDEGGSTDEATVVGHVPEARPGGRASPAVRALAGRLGVDLDGVSGSGPGGVLTSADVEAAAGQGLAPIEPLRGVRRAMAATMATAHAAVAPATLHDLADVAGWPPGTDPTLRLLRAVGVAAIAVPALNAEFLGPDRGRRIHQDVHVGVAVETEAGLFVPVLRDVARRRPADLRDSLDRLRSDVTSRSIAPEELTGATITLSNFGMHGGLFAELVVVPPQVAIVGAGRLHDAVVARSGAPVVRTSLPISLTIDHRVVTGVEANRFLAALISDLQSPT